MKIEHMETCYLALSQAQGLDNMVAAIAALRLDLITLVGEAEQRRLIGEWNDKAAAAGHTPRRGLDEGHLKTCYLALRRAEPARDIIAAVAGLRLQLVALVGEDRQRELIGEWNEIPEAGGPGG